MGIALSGIRVNLLPCKLTELHAISTVDLLGNRVYFLFDAGIKVVKEFEFRVSLANSNGRFCQSFGAFATFCPVVADYCGICTGSKSLVPDQLKFGGGIRTRIDDVV